MCGVILTSGEVPAADFYRALDGTRSRGPHSHGWTDGDAHEVGLGPLPRPPRYMCPAPGRVLVGHSRLATDTSTPGGMPDPGEGQPLVDSGTILAHNGSSTHPDLLADNQSPADSRGLLRMVSELGVESLVDPALANLYGGQPHAAVLVADGSAYALRVDGIRRPAHPLFVSRYGSSTYCVASIPPSDGAELLPVGLTALEDS